MALPARGAHHLVDRCAFGSPQHLNHLLLLRRALPVGLGLRLLVLHGPPQALDEDVVAAAPASVHADLDPAIPQHIGELVAGELRALIGIEDVGLAEPGEGLFAGSQSGGAGSFDTTYV